MEKNSRNPEQPWKIDDLRAAVKQEMARQGVTSQQLADMTQNSKGTIDNFLNTNTDSGFVRVYAICCALGIRLDPASYLPKGGQDSTFQSNYITDMKKVHQREMDILHSSNVRDMETLRANHAHAVEALQEAHQMENAIRDRHLAELAHDIKLWRILALTLIGLLCVWFLWDVTGGGRGLIRYGQSSFHPVSRLFHLGKGGVFHA